MERKTEIQPRQWEARMKWQANICQSAGPAVN